jgi:hypothetical protein
MPDAYRSLLQRAQRTFAQRPISEIVGRTRAIIGVSELPADETDAQTALDKLRNAKRPTPREMAALELMVRLMRPAPFCSNGELADLPKYNDYNAAWVTAWRHFRTEVCEFLYSIGRIDRCDKAMIGTGFLVGDDVLVTGASTASSGFYDRPRPATFSSEEPTAALQDSRVPRPGAARSACSIAVLTN